MNMPKEMAIVFYTPMYVETYVPVTKENVEKTKYSKLLIGNQDVIKKLKTSLAQSKVSKAGVSDSLLVKIQFPGVGRDKIAYVDKSGNIEIGEKKGILEKAALDELVSTLEGVSEIVDERFHNSTK